MHKFLTVRRKSIFIVSLCGLIGVILIIISVIRYASAEYTRTVNQVGKEMSQITERSADAIESYVQSAQNHILNASFGISSVMTDDVLENSQEILDSYISNAPFTNIEYIHADGMNMTNAGAPFDASDREYFKEGIKGNTGICVNFFPKYSEEPLLNFYTPLYRNGKIVGVITGTISGNAAMQDLLLDDYLDQPTFGIVVDENNTIISSTAFFEKGTVVNGENVEEEYQQSFLDAIEKADGSVTKLGGKYDNTICVVQKVEGTNWRIIQIAPSTSIHEITGVGEAAAFREIVGILIVSGIFFLIALFVVRRLAKLNIHQVEGERDEQAHVVLSMADAYYSMHLIDLEKDQVTEYHAQGAVKEIIARGSDPTNAMREVVHATITDEYLDAALAFTDLETIADRMQGKVFTYMDALGKNVGWIRFYFITVDKDLSQRPTRVVVATQIIDEEKRREQELFMKSNSDELTGLLNRRSYMEKIQELEEGPKREDLVYVSMDVNGLKQINDNLGHVAGDELIRGAANCMKNCFKELGSIYRVGGDEFVAILEATPEQLKAVQSEFEKSADEWSGHLVDKLSVSCGYVEQRENMELSIIEVIKLADSRMYNSKAMYYKRKGVDRRGLASAQAKLLSLYKKILKINLTEDSHIVVSADSTEMVETMGFSERISEWFRQFALSGNVHSEDRDAFLARTDLEFLRNHFLQGNSSISVHYRRKAGEAYTNVIMDIILADDYSPENQSLFLYVREVDLQN